jgi:glutaredoxin
MSTAALPRIEVFTTPTCPDCLALKRWLTGRRLPFVERDLRDPAVADEARRRTGLRIAPITIVDGTPVWGAFADQKPRLEALLGLARPIDAGPAPGAFTPGPKDATVIAEDLP